MKPGFYHDLSMADYLAMPAVSASILQQIITRCPRAAWFESHLNPHRIIDASTKAQNAGTIAHMILLEGHSNGVCEIDPNDYPTKSSGNIPAGYTNNEIRAARDYAIAAGKIPVLKDDMVKIRQMVLSASVFIESLKDTEPAIYAAFQPDGGQSEATFVFQVGNTLCRIRPDRISTSKKLIVDVKTTQTSAEPDYWGRTQMIRMGYYTAAAFYQIGIENLCGVVPDYVYLVIEQEPPYLCSLVGIDPHGVQLGAAKIQAALVTWSGCVITNDWPAYPPRVAYPEIPAWESAKWIEREGNDAQGIPYDPAILFAEKDRL